MTDQTRAILRAALTAAFLLLGGLSLLVSVLFGASQPADLPEARTEGTNGQALAVCSIEDLPGLSTVRYVNYTPDEFLQPHSLAGGEVLDLTTSPVLSGRGTLQFVFLNLDPFDERFNEKSEALSPYLGGDSYWHFTLCLPPFSGAVNVYIRASYETSSGEIAGYDFVNYSEYVGKTEEHRTVSEPLLLDLTFYSQRHIMSPDLSIRATTVTIHFEAGEGEHAMFLSRPLVGTDEEVRSAVGRDRYLELALTLVAAITLAAFLFATLLKRTAAFLPQTVLVGAIFGIALLRFLLTGSCLFPRAALVLIRVLSALFPAAAAFSLRERIRKFPLFALFALLCLLPAVLIPLSPPFAAAASSAELILRTAVLCLPLALIVLAVLRGRSPKVFPAPCLTLALAVSELLPAAPLRFLSPGFWLSALTLAAIAALGSLFFWRIEAENRYLTADLQLEVDRRTHELRTMIDDRDKLLRYLSHDLKKPVARIGQAALALEGTEPDPVRKGTLREIADKAEGIRAGLTDLQRYARENYAEEASCALDLAPLLREIRSSLSPDCEANGILLHVVPAAVTVYAKPKMLISVLHNLVFNAIEHAECSCIEITAERTPKACRIRVIDDGKGIETGEDVFRPYYSEHPARENMGLGLYLCRQFLRSMGGDLTYERASKRTVFTATLPRSPRPGPSPR